MELTVIEISKKGRKAYSDSAGNILLFCCECHEIKPQHDFYKQANCFFNSRSNCKGCKIKKSAINQKNTVKDKDYHKKRYQNRKEEQAQYRRENKAKLSIGKAAWRKKNKDYPKLWRMNNTTKWRVYSQNRRTRVKKLPSTLVHSELSALGGMCSLTGVHDVHLDHIIPVKTGHGGTIFGNVMLLAPQLNQSKGARNIFEWAEAEHERLGFTMKRFYKVMTEVASRNNMTLEEYREYVYWCFENKRELAAV